MNLQQRTQAEHREDVPRSAAAERELYRKSILLIVVFFVIHFGMLTLRAAAVELDHQTQIAQARAVLTPMGGLLCYAMSRILRRWRNREFLHQALLGALLCVFCALLHGWIWSYFLFELNPEVYPTTFAKLVYQALYWYLFYFAWTTAYLALSYSITVREQERRGTMLQAEAHGAQMRALRYQINPHFLFNTLNSIAQLIGEDRDQAEKMVLNLSEFFRSSLAVDPLDDVRLADEVALQQLYLDIERVRFPKRLSVAVDMPPDLAGALVPSLILQPLVENAVRHGVARSEVRTCIRIEASGEGDTLVIRISDDAVKDGDQPARSGTGVGLQNVRNRLKSRYGDAFRLEAGPAEPHGFRIELRLPLRF